MDWLPQVVTFVQNVGIPGFLVVGGGIWFARQGFPALIALAGQYAEALCRVADALEAFADKMPDPDLQSYKDK